jgi:halorhodopsin
VAFATAAAALGAATGYFGFRAATGGPDERTVAAVHAVVAGLAAAAYVAQLSGLGLTETTLPVVGAVAGNWVRYLGWALTTPLLLVALLSLAGAGPRRMVAFALADATMITFGFVATNAFERGLLANLPTAIWTFTVAVLLWAVLLYGLYVGVPDVDVPGFDRLRLSLVALWSVYPVVWVLANAGSVGVGVEATAYAALDVTAKVAWGVAAVRLAAGADAGAAAEEPRPGPVATGDD